MIDSVGSYSNMYSQAFVSPSNFLSSYQEEVISSVTASIDGSNLTSEDALDMVNAFSDANIKPSNALSKELDSLGFDANEVFTLANLASNNEQNPPPAPPSKEEHEMFSELLETLLEGKDKKKEENSSAFSQILDYTSQILSLNESAKEDVQAMLNKFQEKSSSYESKDFNNLVKNSLDHVLNDSSNYKSVSFYA